MKLVNMMVIGALLILSRSFGTAQSSFIVDFFPRADSVCDHPSPDDPMDIICTKTINKRTITFIGDKKQRIVRIAAVTLEPIQDVHIDLSRTVQFSGILPKPGKISTWAYVFDRNHDGKIDYLAMVGGAAPCKPDELPPDYPKRGVILNPKQLDLFISYCKIVFNHWADDNYDGSLDAVVHIDLDPDRDWVDRMVVVRSTKFNGSFDDVWTFRGSMVHRQGPVDHTESKVPVHSIHKLNDAITPESFEEKTALLDLLNQAVAQCGLGARNFSLPGESH